MTLKLRNVEFKTVMNASGARGFFGIGKTSEEYKHHYLYSKLFGLDYTGSTFVAKTTTTNPRPGNMPLDAKLRPVELVPRCIVVKPVKGVVLNAVGLSGPGIQHLLNQGHWRLRIEPFVLSFMATGDTAQERLNDAQVFADILSPEVASFSAPVALEINYSCPNIEHNNHSVSEIQYALDILIKLNVPLIIKFNVLEPVSNIISIGKHPALRAITTSNTLPWGAPGVDWKGLFGSTESPLYKRNIVAGGGLSGVPLTRVVHDYIRDLRTYGFRKPIIACGGIMCKQDAALMFGAGANAIQLGVVGILRPWRVRDIIKEYSSG